jgi:hypothetical protein
MLRPDGARRKWHIWRSLTGERIPSFTVMTMLPAETAHTTPKPPPPITGVETDGGVRSQRR